MRNERNSFSMSACLSVILSNSQYKAVLRKESTVLKLHVQFPVGPTVKTRASTGSACMIGSVSILLYLIMDTLAESNSCHQVLLEWSCEFNSCSISTGQCWSPLPSGTVPCKWSYPAGSLAWTLCWLSCCLGPYLPTTPNGTSGFLKERLSYCRYQPAKSLYHQTLR